MARKKKKKASKKARSRKPKAVRKITTQPTRVVPPSSKIGVERRTLFGDNPKPMSFRRAPVPLKMPKTLCEEVVSSGAKAIKTEEQMEDCNRTYGAPWIVKVGGENVPNSSLQGAALHVRTAVVWRDEEKKGNNKIVAVLVRTV